MKRVGIIVRIQRGMTVNRCRVRQRHGFGTRRWEGAKEFNVHLVNNLFEQKGEKER